MACAQILGIEDVPIPGDAGADAAPDVPFDSVVGPDGNVPDGECNGGKEDCANGVDDNCNGLIDCADPVCQGAQYQCVPSVPSGWTLVAFAEATGSTVPVSGACSGAAYGTSFAQGHVGLDAGTPNCNCQCQQSTPTGTTCGPLTIYNWPGSNSCGGSPNGNVKANLNGCGDFGSAQGSIKADPGAPTSQGSCGTPNWTHDVPQATWSNSYLACGYSAPSDDGGCNSGNQCVQMPPTSFDANPCIAHANDVTCPGPPYSKKTLVYTSLSDNRACSACSCNASGGSCTASATGYAGTMCGGSTIIMTADNTCTAGAVNLTSVHYDSQSVTPGNCTATSSTASGSASAQNPVTVCCP